MLDDAPVTFPPLLPVAVAEPASDDVAVAGAKVPVEPSVLE